MTTPAAPGAPEGGQPSGDQPAPGAQDTAPQHDNTPKPQPPKTLGKPNQGQQTAPGASDAKPDGEPAKTDAQDVSDLPEWAQKALKEARAEAGKARTGAKQKAAEEARAEVFADIKKRLGLDTDGEPTVDDLKAQLDERDNRIAELEAGQMESAYRDVVRTAAAAAKADAEALLDSAGFQEAVMAELDDEFTDAQLTEAVAKVVKEYATKPRFAAAAAAPARSGGEMTGAPAPARGRPKSLTQALNRAYGGGGN
jgi:hypothetical protein